MSRAPHVLKLPSWYPTPVSPVRGIFFREQAEALDRAGLEVGIAYPELRRLRTLPSGHLLRNRWQTTARIEEGLPTVRHRGWNFPDRRVRRRLFMRGAAKVVDRYVAEFGYPDLIHAHAAKWAGLAAVRTAERLDLPVVLTEHSTAVAEGSVDKRDLPYLRRAYRGADRVLAVSHALAESLKEMVKGVRVTVVPNVVDTEFFTLPADARSTEPFTFLTVASLRRKKGLDVLLKAFEGAFRTHANVRLRIAGGGPRGSDLQELSRALGLRETVEFLGPLSRSEVRREMWGANVAVVPSRVETFGVVVIEAMATGLPVIATRCGGPEEIITQETGWLVAPEDQCELAEALRTARAERYATRSGPSEIRRYVQDRYSEPVVTRRLYDVYQSLIGSGTFPG